MLKTHQRDLYDSNNCQNIVWNIIEHLLQDCENKLEANDMEEEIISYGPPLNETLKSISDKYIYKGIYMVLFTILKLKLDFDEQEVILQRIADVSSKFYYQMDEDDQYRKCVKDIMAIMFHNVTLAQYLENIRNPFKSYLNVNNIDDEDNQTGRKLTKANTIWYKGYERSRASVFNQKIGFLIKSDEMKELFEKEFEKLVEWFSKFSDKCEINFSGLDPIFPLYKMLDPENTLLPPKLHIAGIKILRKIIELGSKELLGIESDNENGGESEDDEDLDYSEYINSLVSKGCVEFL